MKVTKRQLKQIIKEEITAVFEGQRQRDADINDMMGLRDELVVAYQKQNGIVDNGDKYDRLMSHLQDEADEYEALDRGTDLKTYKKAILDAFRTFKG